MRSVSPVAVAARPAIRGQGSGRALVQHPEPGARGGRRGLQHYHLDDRPSPVDPVQQVKLSHDLVSKKVGVIGLVPLDVKVTGQAVQRARDAGIVVITQKARTKTARPGTGS